MRRAPLSSALRVEGSFWRAAALLFGFRAAAAFVVAYPVTRVAGSFAPLGWPDGDRKLFARGGFFLMETLRLGGKAIAAATEAGGVVGFVFLVLSLVPLSMTLERLLDARTPLFDLAGRAVRRWPSFLFISGVTVLAQAVVVVATALAVGAAGTAERHLDERTGDLLQLGVALPGAVLVLALGALEDLVRAVFLHGGTSAVSAARESLRVVSRSPGRALAGWVVPTLVAAALVGAAAWVTGALDVGRPGALRVAGVFLVHQATVLALCGLRVAWLAVALDLTRPSSPVPPSPGGTPERSDAPVDPTRDPAA